MSEELLIQHCSPTLAGIKTGNLFSCPCTSKAEIMEDVRQLNRRLARKGLCIMPLKIANGRANEAPDDDAVAACEALGAALA